MTRTTDDEIQAMLAVRAARADGVRVGPILDRALRAPSADPPGRGWWRTAVGVGGLAVASLAVVILAVWFAGGVQPSPTGPSAAAVGASPTATPSPIETSSPATSAMPSPSTSPSPSPSSAPAVAPKPSHPVDCAANDLTARILDWQGAAGSRIADIELASRGGHSCFIQGRPEVLLLDAHGAMLIDSAVSGSGPALVRPSDPRDLVSTGHPLRTQVRTSNYCGKAPALPVTVAFVLPNGGPGRLVAVPIVSGAGEAEALPPCNGQGSPAAISTNGWTR